MKIRFLIYTEKNTHFRKCRRFAPNLIAKKGIWGLQPILLERCDSMKKYFIFFCLLILSMVFITSMSPHFIILLAISFSCPFGSGPTNTKNRTKHTNKTYFPLFWLSWSFPSHMSSHSTWYSPNCERRLANTLSSNKTGTKKLIEVQSSLIYSF